MQQQQQKGTITNSKQTEKFALRTTLNTILLIAFMLCQLPVRPLEDEGGEKKQRKDLKALGLFSITSFLSNTPIKAGSSNGPLVNLRFLIYTLLPTTAWGSEGPEGNLAFYTAPQRWGPRHYSSLNPQVPVRITCLQNQFEYNYEFLRMLDEKTLNDLFMKLFFSDQTMSIPMTVLIHIDPLNFSTKHICTCYNLGFFFSPTYPRI